MKQRNVIAIDLAKNSFQVCVMSHRGKVLLNKPISRKQLATYLVKQDPAIVAMEACGGAHHWGRQAAAYGHEVRLLSPRQVKPYRQGHKTDKDAAGHCDRLPAAASEMRGPDDPGATKPAKR